MIRRIIPGDIEPIIEIYNQAIEAGFQTAFTEPIQWQDRIEWFNGHLHAG
jgi:L-amino acid N-acyltransferase YncA